ncbi:MAG: hypothetical protein ABI273_17540 [Lacunisphaera sp.]
MTSHRSLSFTPAGNLSDMLLRDVASLLLTTELISSSLVALRPECAFSNELTHTLNSMVTLCDEGEARVQEPLLESGIVLPTTTDSSPSTLITDFFHRLPTAADPRVFGAEVVINLQLLAQHVELKARLAADEALIVGLDGLNQALDVWSDEWHTCGKQMGRLSFRIRPQPSRNREASHYSLALPQGA